MLTVCSDRLVERYRYRALTSTRIVVAFAGALALTLVVAQLLWPHVALWPSALLELGAAGLVALAQRLGWCVRGDWALEVRIARRERASRVVRA